MLLGKSGSKTCDGCSASTANFILFHGIIVTKVTGLFFLVGIKGLVLDFAWFSSNIIIYLFLPDSQFACKKNPSLVSYYCFSDHTEKNMPRPDPKSSSHHRHHHRHDDHHSKSDSTGRRHHHENRTSGPSSQPFTQHRGSRSNDSSNRVGPGSGEHSDYVDSRAPPAILTSETCPQNPCPDPNGRKLHLWVSIKAFYVGQGVHCPSCHRGQSRFADPLPLDGWFECYWCRKRACDPCVGKFGGYPAQSRWMDDYMAQHHRR